MSGEPPHPAAEGQPEPPPPAGWYPDPALPGGDRARYWDGERWTENYRELEGGRTSIWLAVLGGLLLVSGAIARGLGERDERDLDTAGSAGYIVGGVLGSVLIVLLVRFLYVRLVAKQSRVWSPWILVVAGALAWLAAAGAAVEREDGDRDQELNRVLEQARASCAASETSPFPALGSPFRYSTVGQAVRERLLALVPDQFDGYFEYRFVSDDSGARVLMTSAALGDISYEAFRAGFASRLPPGATTSTLPGGDELFHGPSGKSSVVGLIEGDCYAYALEAVTRPELFRFAEAVAGAD